MGVLQSGRVTPGHIAKWVSDNVLGDGGTIPAASRVLTQLLSADFNTLSDQPLLLPSTLNAFAITGIMVTNAPISLTTAVGGFYPQSSQGGVPIVAASQVYSSLNAQTKLLNATISAAGLATRYSRSNVPDWAVYLALSIAQGVEASADIYLLGVDLSV